MRCSPTAVAYTSADLLSPKAVADPYPLYTALRAMGPVVRRVSHDAWAVTRYTDTAAVIRDLERITSFGALLPSRPAHLDGLDVSADASGAGALLAGYRVVHEQSGRYYRPLYERAVHLVKAVTAADRWDVAALARQFACGTIMELMGLATAPGSPLPQPLATAPADALAAALFHYLIETVNTSDVRPGSLLADALIAARDHFADGAVTTLLASQLTLPPGRFVAAGRPEQQPYPLSGFDPDAADVQHPLHGAGRALNRSFQPEGLVEQVPADKAVTLPSALLADPRSASAAGCVIDFRRRAFAVSPARRGDRVTGTSLAPSFGADLVCSEVKAREAALKADAEDLARDAKMAGREKPQEAIVLARRITEEIIQALSAEDLGDTWNKLHTLLNRIMKDPRPSHGGPR